VTDPTLETFAGMLVRLRKSRLFSREALARASDVGYGTIRDIERGVSRTPHMSTIKKLADALGLDGAERSSFETAALSGGSNSDGKSDESGKSGRKTGRGQKDATGQDPDGRDDTTAADTVAASLLPHDIGSFTGRQDELRRLVDGARYAARQPNLAGIFVIEGMGGVGKTTLAVRVAHLVAGDFPDGQLFLDLHGYTSDLPALNAHQALRSLLRALGVPNELIPVGKIDREAFYRNTVAGKRMLIICDNASSAAQVRPLIPGTGGGLVIITSRTNLRSLDDARVLPLRTPPEREAVELFRTVAGTGHSADDPALAEVVRLCGFLPLAVRIIAARLSRRPALKLADIVAELRHENDRLANLQDEERSVTAVFQSSLRSLPDPAERLLFQRLSLIPGPDFDAYAAASLTGAGYRETRQLLESLLDHNLLLQQIPGRYQFHDLVRAYARTHSVPDAARATSNLLDYYLYVARIADQAFERGLPRPGIPGTSVPGAGIPGTTTRQRRPAAVPELTTSAQAQAWLAAELTNLNAAAHLAARRRRPDVTIGLSAALSDYLRAYGPWPRALALHVAALRAATEVRDAHGQASALRGIGGVQSRTGEIRESKTMLGQAVDIYRQLGDRHGQARALIEFGIAQRVSGDTECLATFTEALAIYRELGDRHGQAAALNELGSVRWQTGPISEAQRHLLSALRIFRELGNRQGQAAALLYLGNVQLVMGELGPAEESLTEAGAIGRELGQPVLVANSQLYLGDVQRAAGLLDDAEKSLSSAHKMYTELSHRQGVATSLAYLGKTQILSGNYARAARSLGQALAVFGELGDRSGQAETLNAYAAVALTAGQRDVARERYAKALRLADEVASGRDKADALAGLASISDADGDTEAAIAGYRKALTLYESMQADADTARVRRILSALGHDGAPG
jgi:tetratricopeptide (TPR) repeat protein/transcriptional regulator with XRE-family HTH domain